MKTYKYIYYIVTNNLNYGKIKVTDFSTLSEARSFMSLNGGLSSFGDSGWLDKYGCCDIVKERLYI